MFLMIGLLVALLTWGVFSVFIVSRRFSTWSLHYRIVAIGVFVGLPLLALSWTCQVLRVTDFDWNQARLAPLFGLRYGYSLYYPPEDGPVIGAIYGPMSYFAYFPSLLANSPVPALLIGSATASLYYLGPVAWTFVSGPFQRREARALGFFFFVLFGFWTLASPPLRYSCFNIHADAPALGFAAVACALLMRSSNGRQPVLALVLSALFTVLSIFSKQSIIFVVPVLFCFIWMADGRRSALQFAVSVAILSAVTLGVFSLLFSAPAMYFNMYGFPSHHGFGGGGFMQFPDGGMASAATALLRAGRKLWEYSRWILLPVGLCYVVEFQSNHPNRFAGREWLRRNRWAVFHFVALGGLPFSVFFGAKVGGDINAFSLFLYFFIIGFLLLAESLVLKHENLTRPALALCFILAAIVTPTDLRSFYVPALVQNLWTSNTEQVYQDARRHPGETYFSSFMLPVLMAEGRMYHSEYGIFDRELGHARVSQEHFLRYVPSRMKYVQREPENSPIAEYLPEFSCQTTRPGFSDLLSFWSDCAAGSPPVQ